MAHARLSPSKFFRAQLCPGSVREEVKYPDTDNPNSLRGTAAHQVAELCLLDSEQPGDYLGTEITVIGSDGVTVHKIKMEQEDIEAVAVYLDYIDLRRQQLEIAEMSIEQKVDPGGWLGRNDISGTLDCQLETDRLIEIVDYKHGYGVVEVEDNPQLLLYAIGACMGRDWSQSDQTETIKMTIVQPRAPHIRGPVRSVEMPAYELFGMLESFKARAAATDDPGAELVPGDKQCKYCKAKAACPALQQQAMGVFAPTASAPAAGTHPQGAWEENLLRPIEVLDTAALFKALDQEPLVVGWFKSVREHLTELAKAKELNPVDYGQKLVHANTKRKWGVGGEELIKKFANLKDVSDKDNPRKIKKAEVTKVVPLTITEYEKQIQPLISERQAQGIKKLIIKPQGAPVLVPLTDPREPIKDAEDVFQPTNQEQAPAAPGW